MSMYVDAVQYLLWNTWWETIVIWVVAAKPHFVVASSYSVGSTPMALASISFEKYCTYWDLVQYRYDNSLLVCQFQTILMKRISLGKTNSRETHDCEIPTRNKPANISPRALTTRSLIWVGKRATALLSQHANVTTRQAYNLARFFHPFEMPLGINDAGLIGWGRERRGENPWKRPFLFWWCLFLVIN